MTAFGKLLAILKKFNKAGIHYELAHYRADTITVMATAPGERWEIDIFEDAHVEIERFTNPYEGEIRGERELTKLLRAFAGRPKPIETRKR